MLSLPKKCNKGFTLLELMVVVALIGLLASLAVPAFNEYMRNSKTPEAFDNLKTLGDGALAYFETEHCYESATCLEPISHLYPGIQPGGAYQAGTDTIPSNDLVGQKSDPLKPSVQMKFDANPWKALNFNISKPYYYKYVYTSEGGPGESTATIQAIGSLNDFDDSQYQIIGNNVGILSNVVDLLSLE